MRTARTRFLTASAAAAALAATLAAPLTVAAAPTAAVAAAPSNLGPPSIQRDKAKAPKLDKPTAQVRADSPCKPHNAKSRQTGADANGATLEAVTVVWDSCWFTTTDDAGAPVTRHVLEMGDGTVSVAEATTTPPGTAPTQQTVNAADTVTSGTNSTPWTSWVTNYCYPTWTQLTGTLKETYTLNNWWSGNSPRSQLQVNTGPYGWKAQSYINNAPYIDGYTTGAEVAYQLGEVTVVGSRPGTAYKSLPHGGGELVVGGNANGEAYTDQDWPHYLYTLAGWRTSYNVRDDLVAVHIYTKSNISGTTMCDTELTWQTVSPG